MDRSRLGALDRFRLAAAFLVVAIHTPPLESINTTADFLLTGVLARLAVPFFMMTTGCFVLPEYVFDKSERYERLVKSVKKTALIYLVATLLYLPIGIYAGHYSGLTPLSAIRLFVFDGTFYHLWYLPAVILGMAIVAALARVFTPRGVLAVSVFLYAAGLLGDSYFALAGKIPAVSAVYSAISSASSYTRNGLFYAPLFLLLGAFAAREKPRARPVLFAASLAAMTVEAAALRPLVINRHDSMYAMLPLCAWLLFGLLLRPDFASSKKMRDVAALIYIIHPAVIVAVRLIVRITGAVILIENSLIYFLCVGLLSAVAAFIAVALWPAFNEILSRLGERLPRHVK